MPGLGTSFGRGGATTNLMDLQNSDCILIEGSNMAEAHPVGFQWVVEAKRRGATLDNEENYLIKKLFTAAGAIQIEGDPDSPVSRGRLCPKGSASEQLVNSPGRQTKIRYRRPGGTDWEDLDLDTAMEMIADRVLEARRKGWQDEVDGKRVNRTMGIASLGGATLDNEENYLMKKLYTSLGAIQIENQARI